MPTMLDQKLTVTKKNVGKRLDVFLSEQLSVSRAKGQKFIAHERITVNTKIAKKSGTKLKKGDVIKIKSNPPAGRAGIQNSEFKKNAHLPQINIIGETSDYIVINKPAGALTHPTEAKESVTAVAWLLKNYPEIKKVGENPARPGIVHRLDKDASGLLVVARKQKMFDHLKTQFQDRTVEKEYTVLVYGNIQTDHDSIDFAIDRGKEGRMVSRPIIEKVTLKNIDKLQPGKYAKTEFWVEERFSRYTLLRVRIHTGRTHQIRVHMLAYNHPVVGDSLYSNKKLMKKNDKTLGRLFLHASKLCFNELSGKRVCFENKLPDELQNFLEKLT